MKFTELLKFGPPTPPPWNPPPPQGGMGKNKLYWFSGQFMTFPGLLIFWPPKIPTATPFGGGGGNFFLSIFSTVHEIYRTFEILTTNPPPPPPREPPPRAGLGKNKFIDFLDSSWHFPDFWFFDPLKFPLRPPPLGGEVNFFR